MSAKNPVSKSSARFVLARMREKYAEHESKLIKENSPRFVSQGGKFAGQLSCDGMSEAARNAWHETIGMLQFYAGES